MNGEKLKLSKSKDAFEVAKKYIPDGVNSSYRSAVVWKPYPIFINHSVGSRIYDVDGNEYIDYFMGYGALILGHSHPAIINSLTEQIKKGYFFGLPHELSAEVAKKIVEGVPCADMVRFGTTGSECVQAAIRLARAYTGKNKIVKFEGHYHGWHDYIAVSIHPPIKCAGLESSPTPVPASPGIPRNLLENIIVLPWNNIEVLEKCLERHSHEIAAVIAEPLMCNSGCIPPITGYLETLRKLTREHDVLLIFDEVITGFRLAFGGAQEYFNVTPDLAVFGKALGGGLPVAAFAGKKEVMQLLEDAKVIHSGTYNANPLSMAAANAALTLYQSEGGEIYKRLFKIGEKLIEGLRNAIEDTKVNAIVQGMGPVFQIFFTKRGVITNYREACAANQDQYELFHKELLKHGILIHPSMFERIAPSAVHTDEEADRTIQCFYEALRYVRAQQ